MKTYATIYFVSFFLAVLFTPIVIWAAHKLHIYDACGIRKIHRGTIPRIGGAAIFLSTMVLVTTFLFLDNNFGKTFGGIRGRVFSLLITGTFIFFVGLVDDVRGLRVRHKLLAQIAAAIIMCLAGVRIEPINILGMYTLDLGWFSFPVTILWIVAVTNAVNLIDGLDGLAAGISAIACGTIAVFSIASGQIVMAAIMLAILGSLSGFLIFNFNPARIFMGDCGSMFLGFMLAGASVICSAKSGTVVGLALAVLSLSVPIFDMAFTMLRRYLQDRRIMSPDRSHLHHLLLDLGLRQRHVVICMYIMTALAAGAGLFMMLSHGAAAILIFACAIILQILVFRLIGAVNLRKTLAGLRQKFASSYTRKQEVGCYEQVELHFQQAKTFDTWWHAVCFAADEMDFCRINLPLTNRDGSVRNLVWQNEAANADPSKLMQVTVPIKDRREGPSLQLNVRIATNNSLESAGHRTALLTRLMERYGLANLSPKKTEKPSETTTFAEPVAVGVD